MEYLLYCVKVEALLDLLRETLGNDVLGLVYAVMSGYRELDRLVLVEDLTRIRRNGCMRRNLSGCGTCSEIIH